MINDNALAAAKHILSDRNGANYYKDIDILASYIKGALDVTEDVALQTATDINDDRSGADYYADPTVLATFLNGRMS
jgi:hypothetical protein